MTNKQVAFTSMYDDLHDDIGNLVITSTWTDCKYPLNWKKYGDWVNLILVIN